MVDESYLLLSPAQFPVQWLLFVQGPDSEVKGQAGLEGVYITGTHCDLSITFHNTDLDVLCASLHDLEKTLYRKFNTLVARHIIFVVLL